MSAFPGTGHKDRVCIVDVGVNLPARWRLMQEIEAAVADGQMVHLSGAAGAPPNYSQLTVAPECAIEKNEVGSVNAFPQFIRQFADTWCEKRSCSRRIVPKVKRDARGQFNRSKSDGAAKRLKFAARLAPLDSTEPCKDVIEPGESGSCFVGRVNDQRYFLFPQKQ